MNEQKAVSFFKQAGLSRLIEKLREKYIELDRAGGQVMLEESTESERQAIASFLSKPLSGDMNLRVRVADVEKAVVHSFGCSLPALLSAYFPEQPLVTRQEQRATRTARQDAFHRQLAAIVEELPEGSRGRRWLLNGPHGLEWLFARYKNEPTHEQKRQRELVRYVAQTLDRLPGVGMPERLALFAQRTSGDPHALDADRPAGRLFLYALADLARDVGELVDGSKENDGLKDREQVLRLYADVGLLVDTISSSVAVFHLVRAVYHDSRLDRLVEAAGERVLVLPLRQLLEWQVVVPAQSDIFVFENPQVFEEAVVGLVNELPGRRQASPLPYYGSRRPPTLVCTSGWTSTAALRLLQMLVHQSEENRLYYSGDFDLKGLQIAASLMARFPGRCYPWRFDAESYTLALQAGGVAASSAELAALSMLPEVFTPLVAVMCEKGMWAYQEGIARLLVEDVKRHSSLS